MMQLQVLGPVRATENGESVALGGPRQRAVLALLVAFANEPVSSDRLIDEIWGEEPPAEARNSLQSMISNLRKALAEDDRFAIERSGRSYELVAPSDGVDSLLFAARVEAARELIGLDLEAGIREFDSALGLWRGAPYSDVDEAESLRADAARLEELRLRAVEYRVEGQIAAGRAGDVVGELEALVDEHRLREGLHRLLMAALVHSGRQTEALRVAGRLRQTLAQELGIEPSPELVQLEQQILDQTVERPTAEVGRAANPYRGLESFTEADADRFFGRGLLTELLIERMSEDGDGSRLLAVVGASGSGKSSMVRAGLIPAIRRGAVPGSEGWVIVQMVPGSTPLRDLEAAVLRVAHNPPPTLLEQLSRDELGLRDAAERILPDDDSELLLMIDQFEELFTTADPEESAQLVNVMVGAVTAERSRVRVVITLRADFYDRPLGHPALAPLLAKRLETVVAMTPGELSEAITGPAQHVGVNVEPALVGAIIADATGQPGALPMVQYALTELFDHRANNTMTLDDYRHMGGIRGAIRQRAESLYEAFGPEDQERLRRLLLQLVRLGEGDEYTRRRMAYPVLAEDFGDELIDALASARLVSIDQDAESEQATVEVAHEALLREWPRLKNWIAQSHDDLRTLHRLQNSAHDWDEADRSDEYLLTGTRLTVFEDWRMRAQMSLGSVEAEFLETSVAVRDGAALRRRRLMTGLAAVTAAALVVGTVVVVRTVQMAGENELAQARQLALAATAATQSDPQLALLLALEAVEQEPVAEAIEALHLAIDRQRVIADLGESGGAAAFVDDPTVAVLNTDGTIRMYDISQGPPVEVNQVGNPGWIPVEPIRVDGLVDAHVRPWLDVSGDGQVVAVGSVDGSVYVVDLADRWEPWSTQIGVTAPRVALNHDGSLVAARALTSRADGSVVGSLFESATGERLWDFEPCSSEFLGAGCSYAVAFTPALRERLVIDGGPAGGSVVGRFQTLDPESGAQAGEPFESRSEVPGVLAVHSTRLYLSQAGPQLGPVQEVDLGTGRVVARFSGHRNVVLDLALNRTGAILASAGVDGTARVWETLNGVGRLALPLAGSVGVDVDLSPDGSKLVTVDETGTVFLWDVSPWGNAEVFGDLAPVPRLTRLDRSDRSFVEFLGSSSELISLYPFVDEEATFTNVVTGERTAAFLPTGQVFALSPDGTKLAIAREGLLTVVEIASGSQEMRGEVGSFGALQVTFSPNARFVGVLLESGEVELFDREAETSVRFEAVRTASALDWGHLEYDGLGNLHVLAASDRAGVWTWDGTGEAVSLGSYQVPADPAALALSGTRLIAADRTGLWSGIDVELGRPVARGTISHDGEINAIDIDAVSGIFATGGRDGVIRVWDLETGDHLYKLADLGAEIESLSFGFAGSMLAATTADVIKVYTLDLEDLIEVARSRLLRDLTDEECLQYLRVDSC